MPYAEAGAISLHYNESGSGGIPVLLLHELGGAAESWEAALSLFARSRRTIAVDLRCAGRSEKPMAAFGIADLANDLDKFLGVLGLGTVDVVGAALGSLVGALLATRHPSRVRRLVMCAVSADMAGTTADYLTERASRVRRDGMRAVADASLGNAFPDNYAAAKARYRPLYLANYPAAYANLSLALADLRMTATEWSAIRAPTLVASGEHDFIWPHQHGRHVAALIPGAQFALLPDAGHFPHMQTPDALVALATDFLDPHRNGYRDSPSRRNGFPEQGNNQ